MNIDKFCITLHLWKQLIKTGTFAIGVQSRHFGDNEQAEKFAQGGKIEFFTQ